MPRSDLKSGIRLIFRGHFECYADDIVVHCRSEKQLEMIEHQIRRRFARCRLEFCAEKNERVYCKDSKRTGHYPNQSFDFLGYTFRPWSVRDRNGTFFVSFSSAVSGKALKAMRTKLKGHPWIKVGYSQSIEDLAKAFDPKIQGWITYYAKFRKSAMSALYSYINDKLLRWVQRKFKSMQRRKWRAGRWLRELYRQNPTLFTHWRVWRWVAE